MSDTLQFILNGYLQMLFWLAGFFVVFSVLSVFMPCNPGQRWWRKGSLTDICYYFVMPMLTRVARIVFMGAGVYFLFGNASDETIENYLQNGYGPLSQWPLWLQAAIVFVVSDVLLYWTHRWFHRARMWRFHAIHHSPAEVDWLSTYRFHPVNVWLSFTLVDSLMLFMGFSPESVSAMAIFNMIYSAMVHANLNWTFGPLRYVIASPVFHRWHHTAQAEGLDKNFAPTFPVLDIIFGTFYMPKGRRPEIYGVTGKPVPQSFVAQMLWPFRRQ